MVTLNARLSFMYNPRFLLHTGLNSHSIAQRFKFNQIVGISGNPKYRLCLYGGNSPGWARLFSMLTYCHPIQTTVIVTLCLYEKAEARGAANSRKLDSFRGPL